MQQPEAQTSINTKIHGPKLTQRSNISAPNQGIVLLDKNRGGIGGTLAFSVHHSIKYSTITLQDPNDVIELAIELTSGSTKVTVVNVYIFHRSYRVIAHLLDVNFNAHHALWFSAVQADPRGNTLAEQINDSEYGVLNDQCR